MLAQGYVISQILKLIETLLALDRLKISQCPDSRCHQSRPSCGFLRSTAVEGGSYAFDDLRSRLVTLAGSGRRFEKTNPIAAAMVASRRGVLQDVAVLRNEASSRWSAGRMGEATAYERVSIFKRFGVRAIRAHENGQGSRHNCWRGEGPANIGFSNNRRPTLRTPCGEERWALTSKLFSRHDYEPGKTAHGGRSAIQKTQGTQRSSQSAEAA